MLSAAAPYLSKPLDLLDADPYLVALPNGTIELGGLCEFRRSSRKDYCTRVLGVPFDRAMQCPSFTKFLERILPESDMREFVQRIFLANCLSGSTREHVIFSFGAAATTASRRWST